MNGKFLGKITAVKLGPHPDLGFGLSLTFSFNGGGTDWFETVSSNETLTRLVLHCREAKVDDVSKLKGIPIEVMLEDNTLVSWRILTEVL